MIRKLWAKVLDWFYPDASIKPRASTYEQGTAFARKHLAEGGPKARSDLGNWLDASRMFNDFNDFDRGIQDVLQEVRNGRIG